jgi:hypothetical protein
MDRLMSFRHLIRPFMLAAALSALPGGCAPATRAPWLSPLGAYAVTLAADAIPSIAAAPAPGFATRWEIVLHEDSLVLWRDRSARGGLALRTGGAELILGGWIAAGPGCATGARYAWRIEADGLILTPIEDGCVARILVLSTFPLASGRALRTAGSYPSAREARHHSTRRVP